MMKSFQCPEAAKDAEMLAQKLAVPLADLVSQACAMPKNQRPAFILAGARIIANAVYSNYSNAIHETAAEAVVAGADLALSCEIHDDWRSSEAATEAKARSLGLWPAPLGVGWDELRTRIADELQRMATEDD